MAPVGPPARTDSFRPEDPHRLDHLTVALGHPDAVTALSAGYGKASITAHIAVQPFTDRGLKLPGAHIITDSRKVFGGPLTQITLLATKPTKDKNPTLFKAVANALEESIKAASADKRHYQGDSCSFEKLQHERLR